MAAEDLKAVLKAIDPDKLGMAFMTASLKSQDTSEATIQVEALFDEYPALALLGTIAKVHAADSTLDNKQIVAYVSGAMAACMAFKELVDTELLNEIPTSE